ncbi:Gar1/Naf1 RNA-binding region protein [Toxoplasma gondii TgCatPRC2]|uniref:H/ACA ribonucleoprotein complex non-core subunit NAF1 n=1 Tax=Toxoplasma gondii TgCatPRC2 TaxID=1130821 RepID=A0A151HJQ4_TOXGO|nr:Gar1/Naf1 RNA-binding region protein [Toxoplasma gondii TgCatPRC2]
MEAAGECAPSSSSSSSPTSSCCDGSGSSPPAEGVSVQAERATDAEMPEASSGRSFSTCDAACASASEKQEVEGTEELAVIRSLGKARTSSVSRGESSSEEESDEEEMSPERRHAAKMSALQEALQRDLVIDGDAEIDDLLVAAHVAQIENQLLEAQQKAGNLRNETMEKLLSSGKGASLSEAADGETARAEKQDESAMKDEGEEDDEDEEDTDDQEVQALMKNEERFRQRLLPHPESTPTVAEALRRAKTALSASTASASSGPQGAHAENATHAEASAGEPRIEGKKGAEDAIGKEGKEDYADKLKGLLALIGKEPEEDEIDEEEEDEGNAKGEDGDALGMWTGIDPIEVEGLPAQVAPDCAVKACGVVHALVGSMLVVKGDENSNPMDLGSVVCLEDKTVLGAIADTFGPVAAPFYVVCLPEEPPESRQKQQSSPASPASSLRSRLSVGLRVYSDVLHSSFLLGQHGQVPAYLKSLHRPRLHYASGEEDNSEDEDDEDDDRMSCVSGASSRSASSQRSLRGRGRGLSALGFRKDGDRASRACLKETYEDAGKEISPEEEAALELQKQQREQQQKLRTEAMLRQFSQARGEGQKPAKPGLSRASGGRPPPAWAPPVGCASRPAFAVPAPGGARGAQRRSEAIAEPRGGDRRRSGYQGPAGGEAVGGARCGAGQEKTRGGAGSTGMHAQASSVPPPPSGPEAMGAVRANCPLVGGEAQHTGAALPSGSLASPCHPQHPQPPASCHAAGAEAPQGSFALGAVPHSPSGTHMPRPHPPPSHLHTGCCHRPQTAGPGCGAPSFSCVHACACTQTHVPGGGACSYPGAPGVGCTGYAAGTNASACSPGLPAFPHGSPPTSGFGLGVSHALGAGGPGAPGQFHCPLATSGVSTPHHGSAACLGPSFGQPHGWAAASATQRCFSHSHGEPGKAEANRGTAAVSSVPPWARTCGQPAPPASGAYTPHGTSHPPPSSSAFPATGQGVRPPPPPPAFR